MKPVLVLLVIQQLASQSPVVGQESLLGSAKILTTVRGWLQRAQDAHLGQPYVDWVLQKLNVANLYVSAGQALAEKLDPDLVDAIGNAISRRQISGDGSKRSTDDYVSSWRYRPANIPAFVRKSKTKISPGDDEEEEDLHPASSHGGSYGGGYGGGGKTH